MTFAGPPIISVGSFPGGRVDANRAVEMHDACLETGFFVAVDHGLEAQVADLFDRARAFFALPAEDKLAIPRHNEFGFVPHASQGPRTHRRTSSHTEFLDLGLADECPLPDLAGFSAAVRGYQADALRVAAELLGGLAVSLDIDASYFDGVMERPECKLRFLHYPAVETAPDGALPVPTTPHTDYGLLTLLATDGVPGLEVKPVGGDWTPVSAPAGSLVVNLGDMLARWSNDIYRSTPHRVVGPAAGERYSIPFFINPASDTVIDCIPTCVSEEHPCGYPPVTAGDFLAQRRVGSDEPYIDPTSGPARRP